MRILFAVENRLDVLREPAVACLVQPCVRAVVVREGEGVRDSRALGSFCRQGVDQVAHDRIADAVADEDDGEFSEQLRDEPCRPPFGQICATEVRSGEDELRAVFIARDASMQVHEA